MFAPPTMQRQPGEFAARQRPPAWHQHTPDQAHFLRRSLGNEYSQSGNAPGWEEEGLLEGETEEDSDGGIVQRACDCGGTCPDCAGRAEEEAQAGLTVGSPDDAYEQAADRAADQVMRLIARDADGLSDGDGVPSIQRQGEEEEDQPADNPILAQIGPLLDQDGVQARAEGGATVPPPGFATALAGTKGGGQPIPQAVRSRMEHAFRADFRAVRLHTDSTAVQLSRGIAAHAFTHGSDIYFNSGRFDSGSQAGNHLLAHELTHTIQQGSGRIQRLAITRTVRTASTCGGRRVRWTFTLGSPAPADGYIVQKVTQLQTAEPCPSNVGSISLTPTALYWEAWPVSAGATTHQLEASLGYTDQGSRAPRPNQSGLQASLGTVKFFLRSTTGDLGTYRTAPGTAGSAWGPGRAPDSGILPSTTSAPSWWSGAATEGPASRWASSWWNCCGDPATQFSRIDSNP